MTKLSIYGVIFLMLITVLSGVATQNADPSVLYDENHIIEEEVEIDEVYQEEAMVVPDTRNREEVILPEVDIPGQQAATSSEKYYTVLRVIDGDTIMIDKDGLAERVRMIGVDTPETVHPSEKVGCFGEEASNRTKTWLEGRKVRLKADTTEGERDKYRRLLGYIYRDDGLFINLELIRQGYAYEYTYNITYDYQAEFKAAENEAKLNSRGLWSEGVCQQ